MMMSLILSMPVAGVIFAFRQSNDAGKVIVIILFVGSIITWSVMLTKFKDLHQARKASQQFISAYRSEGHPVSLFLKRQKFAENPLSCIYDKSCAALGVTLESHGADPEDLFMGGIGSVQKLEEIHLRSIRNIVDRSVTEQVALLENAMGWLAIATTTAPLLGLLGTVWGVMESFGAMAITGAAMLSAVAPGISGALLTTVIGLLVALPSAIGYNMLSDQIRRLTVQTDNFAQELISDMECQHLQMK